MAGPETRYPEAIIFGRRLREHRTRLGYTQEQLAERASMHWTYIGQTERGQRNLTLRSILRLASALDIDPGDLIRGMKAE